MKDHLQSQTIRKRQVTFFIIHIANFLNLVKTKLQYSRHPLILILLYLGTETKKSTDCKPHSSIRPICPFGISCYRKNPQHKIDEAHPGDNDYKVKY